MKLIRILAALALGASLSGCGGGGGPSPGTEASPTAAGAGLPRKELAARANAICKLSATLTSAVPQPPDIQINATSAAAYFDRVSPIAHQATTQLEALVPAADAAADWRAFVTAQVSADRLFQTLKQKADAKDPSGIAFLKQVEPTVTLVNNAAKKIGATVC